MRRSRRVIALAAALALFPLAACATAGQGEGGRGGGESATIVVDNYLAVPGSVTVYAVTEVGSRQLLGSVNPSSRGTLVFRSGDLTGTYRFVARTSQGSEVVSTPVALTGGERVRWDLRNNAVFRLGTQ